MTCARVTSTVGAVAPGAPDQTATGAGPLPPAVAAGAVERGSTVGSAWPGDGPGPAGAAGPVGAAAPPGGEPHARLRPGRQRHLLPVPVRSGRSEVDASGGLVRVLVVHGPLDDYLLAVPPGIGELHPRRERVHEHLQIGRGVGEVGRVLAPLEVLDHHGEPVEAVVRGDVGERVAVRRDGRLLVPGVFAVAGAVKDL